MKTPRVTDFHPDAKVPPLKSPLEGMPTIGKPPRSIRQDSPPPTSEVPEEEQKNVPTSDRPTAQPGNEATARPPDRVTNKRVLVRRGFEWFEDQLAALKRLSLYEQMEGKDGSMSAMVSGALDDYLKKRAAQEITDRATARPGSSVSQLPQFLLISRNYRYMAPKALAQ